MDLENPVVILKFFKDLDHKEKPLNVSYMNVCFVPA